MSSVTPSKRAKISKENDYKKSAAESGFHSEIDFSSNQTSDFSLPAIKRKSLATSRASLLKFSLDSSTDNTQQSLGYSSYTNLTSTTSLTSIPRTSRTPKKRKSEISASDENFYNSFQFVSPVKQRKKDANDQNCAKLVLKEKSSSANVILCSTPIRNSNKNTKWGKFRSFHQEKFQTGKSLDDDEPIEKVAATPPIKSIPENSLSLSNLEFSNLSGNFSIQQDIPSNLQNLWTDDIIKHPKTVSFDTKESQARIIQQSIASTSSSSPGERRKFFNGRTKFDILGKLHATNDIAARIILSFLDAETLLSLSHVSSDYRHMIQSTKLCEAKRLNYLKNYRAIKENKLPLKRTLTKDAIENIFDRTTVKKKKKTAFGDNNLNISTNLRHKTPSSPQSPSSQRFNTIQKIAQKDKISTFNKCPRCRKPAKVNSIKIRNSPRKKKSHDILKLSTTTGSIQKLNRKSFLSKTSIPDNFREIIGSPYVKLSHLQNDLTKSPDRSSSSFDTSNSSSSDDSCEPHEIYEYGICTGVGCSYRFCLKCNCKYHPRRICGDLSPPSPSRNNNSKILAGTEASRKSLKRLINY